MGEARGRIPTRNTNAQPQPVTLLPSIPVTDNQPNGNLSSIQGYGFGYDGVAWDRLRTPTTFKTVQATASGNSSLWAPATGKRFRLMRWTMMVTAQAAIAGGGNLEVVLNDGVTPTGAAGSFFIPATGSTNFQVDDMLPWIDWGNGYLSANPNNLLNVNLSAALTAGEVRVIVAGTEE